MAKDISALLRQDVIAGVFEGIKPGFPTALPSGFYQVSKREMAAADGMFTYDKVEGTRKVARTIRYNGKSAVRNVSGVDTIPVKALFSAEHLDFDVAKLINLRGLGNGNVQEGIAMQEINRRLAEARQLQQNLRNASVHLSLLDGILYRDVEGNLLPSSVGAVYTTDWAIPAGNKDQITDSAGSTIIDAKWSTAATDIIGHVNKIKSRALDQTGYPLKYAIYGPNILGNVMGNTAAVNLMQSSPVFNSGIIESGEFPNPFLGLTWIRGDQFFWSDNDGTIRRPVGADDVVFLPEPDPSWYDLVETSYLWTDKEGVAMNMNDITLKMGPSIQMKIESDPVTASAIYRDAFLPTINVPAAIFIADTNP